MENKFCETCKQELPLEKFEAGKKEGKSIHHKSCVSCYKKVYYKKNKVHILKLRKKYWSSKSEEKKKKGLFNWKNSLKDEEDKFKFFLNENNIKDLSDLQD
jgi:hypothetical protein